MAPTQDPRPPLLKEIFERAESSASADPPPQMSVGTLAKSLNVTTAELLPFIQAGYIRLVSPSQSISSMSLITAVPEQAINWMRSWFLPVAAKPLFSVDNMADLLNILPREVLPLAAAHEVPVMRDPGAGFVFSTWAARTLLLRSIRGRDHSARFDRIALLWMILEEDPEKAAAPPSFDRRVELELERVAKLEEPVRSLRSAEIMAALHDSWALAEAIRGGKKSALICEKTSIGLEKDLADALLPEPSSLPNPL